MRQYELMVVLAPDIADDQMPAALDRVSGYITGPGGEITELNTTAYNALTLGRRRLAYPINKYRDGYYALYHFNAEPSEIAEMERELHLNTQVLRHLVTAYEPPKQRPPRKPRAGASDGNAPAPETAGAAAATTAERAPLTSASGASVDVDTPVPLGPDGEDNDEPPTAETPEVDE